MVEKDAPKIAPIDCVHTAQVLLEVLGGVPVQLDPAVTFAVGVDERDDPDRLAVFVLLRTAKHLCEPTLHFGRLSRQDILSQLLGPHVHIREEKWLLRCAIG